MASSKGFPVFTAVIKGGITQIRRRNADVHCDYIFNVMMLIRLKNHNRI